MIVCLLSAGLALGARLDVWAGTLGTSTFTTGQGGASSVEFQNSGLGVTTTGGKDFLVLSSFTTANTDAEKDRNRAGRWQIATDYTGGNYTYSTAMSSVSGSAIYERWMQGKQVVGSSDYGSVNMNGIYNFGSSGSHSFDLYHRTNGGSDVVTRNGSMLVVSLNVAGTTLRHGTAQQDSSITANGPTPYMSTTTSDSWSKVKQSSGGSDLAATIDVSEYGGEVFVAASMNCNKLGSGGDAVKGDWQLVLYDSGGTEVERLGTSIQRVVVDANKDDGAAMLYATTSDLDAGTYTVKLEQKVDAASATAGLGVETFNASINAVALTLQDGDEAGQRFESFSVGNTDTEDNATGTPQRAVEDNFITIPEDQGLILASHYTTSGDGVQTGDSSISLYNLGDTESVYDSVNTLRSVGSNGPSGAGGVIGYADSLTAGDYEAALNFLSDANTFSLTDANLVGFATVSVPEPSMVSLLALFATACMFNRRRFSR